MFDKLPKHVKVVEVGPRDGLQNEAQKVSLEDKVEFVQKLIDSGIQNIEVGSFVSPKAVPQMQNSDLLLKEILNRYPEKNFHFPCLVPNMKGMEDALKCGVKEIAIFTSTSNTFNQKNINTTIEGSLERARSVVELAHKENVKVRAYISTVFGCPYERVISVEQVLDLVKKVKSFGPYEISLGDTIGVATPLQVFEVLSQVEKEIELSKVALHFHDTRGMALTNILVALGMGISTFDSSAGGLGGCPYAKGATGNVATEDLCYLLDSLKISTSVNISGLIQASSFILSKINKETTSKYLKSILNSADPRR